VFFCFEFASVRREDWESNDRVPFVFVSGAVGRGEA
jgi:hypothetical protein